MDCEIGVSICCNTYNHGKYIAQTLDSFLMQKTNFKIEVLVHDDASTDETADIIKEYEQRYPDIIKPIYQKINQYSQGINITKTFQNPRVKGKYVAFCEGDDYWTDPLKLQKQYEALERHLEINICAHRALEINAHNSEIIREIAPKENDCILPLKDVIKGGGAYVATNSLMYRASLLKNEPEFRKIYCLDYTLQVYGSLYNGMLYLNDCMAVYRFLTAGSWTKKVKSDKAFRNIHHSRLINMYKQMNVDTNQKYSKLIKRMIFKARLKNIIYNLKFSIKK